jgi:hypothetical protein
VKQPTFSNRVFAVLARKRRGLIGSLLVMALFATAVYAIFWRELPQIDVFELLRRIGPDDLLRATVVYTIDLALAIAGWVLVFGTLSGVWHLGHHLRIYTITAVTKRLPGTFWYMLGRVVMYERLGVARNLTLLVGGLELGLVTVGGLLVVVVTFPLVLNNSGVSPLLLVAMLAVGAALMSPPVVRALMRRFYPAFDPQTIGYRHLVAWILLYALVWSVGGGILFVLVDAIKATPLSMLPTIIGIWATSGVLMTVLNFLPLSLGAHEITLAGLLSLVVDPGEALVIALLMRAVLTANEVLWALIGVLLGLTPWARIPADAATPIESSEAEALSSSV